MLVGGGGPQRTGGLGRRASNAYLRPIIYCNVAAPVMELCIYVLLCINFLYGANFLRPAPKAGSADGAAAVELVLRLRPAAAVGLVIAPGVQSLRISLNDRSVSSPCVVAASRQRTPLPAEANCTSSDGACGRSRPSFAYLSLEKPLPDHSHSVNASSVASAFP